MKIEFVKDKETKNTIRFTATGGDVSGSLYVAKGSDLASGSVIAVEVSEQQPAEAKAEVQRQPPIRPEPLKDSRVSVSRLTGAA